mgnify:CR=1 FL=1
MRQILLGLFLLLPTLSFAQGDIEYKKISYSELIQMIEAEKDTIFTLNNTVVIPNEETDQDFRISFYATDSTNDANILTPLSSKEYIIDKALEFDNVLFANGFVENMQGSNAIFYGFHHVTFSKHVRIDNSAEFIVVDSHFQQGLSIRQRGQFANNYNIARALNTIGIGIGIARCNIDKKFRIQNSFIDEEGEITVSYILNRNKIRFAKSDDPINSFLDFRNINSFDFRGNTIQGDFLNLQIDAKNDLIDFNNNRLETKLNQLDFSVTEESRFNFGNNVVTGKTVLNINPLLQNVFNMEFEQFQGPILSYNGFGFYLESRLLGFSSDSVISLDDSGLTPRNLLSYEKAIISYAVSYRAEMSQLGSLYQFYKTKHDMEGANLVYMRLKDLETRRLQYLYQENPGFTTFFKWKINQFLKIFSAYGTEPARAITMSVYVVLAFALIYLFFPNHWDSHGKNRIKDRFLFFHKYLRLNKGIQDVYLEEQSEEIASSHAFRKVLDDHKDEVPSFFYNAAKPLLRWSTAGTTIYSQLLSRVDFLKGSWKETDPKVRGLKTALTIVIFIIALAYDMLIKMLNALMLSINTFTTLGFGEIPIKGLPRYLAIIQGFIGWFMLTIFSVSLISQLLN